VPSGSHDELPEVEIIPGYSSRLADWGRMTVAFEKAHKGQDAVRRNYAAGAGG
jgi:hypothetical protein